MHVSLQQARSRTRPQNRISLHTFDRAAGDMRVNRMLCAVEVTRGSYEPIVREAVRIAAKNQARLDLVEVFQMPFWFVDDLRDQMAGEISRVLDRELAAIPLEGVEIHRHVVEGQPLPELDRLAVSLDPDLILIQRHMNRVPAWGWLPLPPPALGKGRAVVVVC